MTVDTCVYLSASECAVLLDVSAGRLPAVRHWGADLGALREDEARAIAEAQRPAVGTNQVDAPVRLAVLPEHHTGWTGRPGLSGLDGGRLWSPAFEVRRGALDGVPVGSYVRRGRRAGVEVRAVDDEAALELDAEVELLPSGLLRVRAAVTNLARGALPGRRAGPRLPGAGRRRRAARLRRPLRQGARAAADGVPHVGIHLRENRRGRTGADGAVRPARRARPASASRAARSGRCTPPGAATTCTTPSATSTGERLLGGGELLLPGEMRLGTGETYSSPWIYGAYGDGLDAVARRFHRTCGPGRARSRPSGRSRSTSGRRSTSTTTVDRLLALAERAAEVGVERFVLDDGWFGARRDDRAGLGDWVVSADVWPDGLHPLVDRVPQLGHAVRAVVRAGDGQPRLRRRPRAPGVDHGRRAPDWPVESRAPAGAQPRHPGGVRVRREPDPGAARRVRHRLPQVGPQPRPRRGRRPDRRRPARRARPDPGVLPAARRAPGGASRTWRSSPAPPAAAGSTSACSSAPTGCGCRTASTRSSGSACCAGPPSCCRRSARLAHRLAAARTPPAASTTSAFRAGTALFGHLGIEWDLARPPTERASHELAAWIALLQGAPRPCCSPATSSGWTTSDDGCFVHGVVAPDRARPWSAWRRRTPLSDAGLRLAPRPRPGADLPRPAGVRRLRAVGPAPAAVGGARPTSRGRADEGHPVLGPLPAATFPGLALPGAALERPGMRPPSCTRTRS